MKAQATSFAPEGPQPLQRATPPGAAYPVHALGPLRAAVEEVQAMTQAPVAIPAQSALAVASLAVQGFADVDTLGGARPPSGAPSASRSSRRPRRARASSGTRHGRTWTTLGLSPARPLRATAP